MYNGIINVYKEKGFTSHDAVAKMRGILKQKKIGHTGTLDPDAEGVLPLCLGSATKLCDMLTDKDKEYEAVLLLGMTTDTQDISGQVLSESQPDVTEGQVREAVSHFVGEYEQLPPMYSAKKINGKKLYELAREGKTVERNAARVQISAIEILEINLPEVFIRVNCSKGTYIRTLCHDIGQLLGCGACMKTLLRIRVSSFFLKDSLTLSQVEKLWDEGRIQEALIPAEDFFREYNACVLKEEYTKLIYNGNPFSEEHLEEGGTDYESIVRVYDSRHIFIGIYRYQKEREMFYPVKMFLPE